MYLLLTPMLKMIQWGYEPTKYSTGSLVTRGMLGRFMGYNYFCGLIIDTETRHLYELEHKRLIKRTFPHIVDKFHMNYGDAIAFHHLLTSDVSLLHKSPTLDRATDIDELLHALLLARLKGDI